MNVSELNDQYLAALYLKSKNNLEKGYNVYVIAKLIGLDEDQAQYVKEYLERNGLIEKLNSKEDPITILSSLGLEYVSKLRENKAFKTIRFTGSQYPSPKECPSYFFIYTYELIDENRNVESKTIKVSISDVLSMLWGYSHDDLEKVLLQFAKDTIIEKLKYGSLKVMEDIKLMRKSYPDKCPYNPQNLIEPIFAEYEVEIGQKLIPGNIDKDNLIHH